MQRLRALVALLDRARAQGHAGVVHEHVDVPLGLGHLLHERRERGLVRDVGDDGDYLAFRVRERLAVRADGGVQGVLAPPGDV